MGDNGLDNSEKEVAVTLVWQRNCDLDIHVFEPSGFEIFYGNMSSEYGNLDVDITYLRENVTFAIENISYGVAPAGCYKVAVTNYGACEPSVDYTYFIKTGDNISVFQEQAPSGDSSTIVVAEFCWSGFGSRQAANIQQVKYPYEFSDERKEFSKIPKGY